MTPIICVFIYDHLKAFLYFRVPETKNPRLLWKNLEFAEFSRLEFFQTLFSQRFRFVFLSVSQNFKAIYRNYSCPQRAQRC